MTEQGDGQTCNLCTRINGGKREGSAMQGRIAGFAAAICLAIAVAGSMPCQAQPKINLDLSSLSDRTISDRTAFLERKLDDERRSAQWWTYGWLAFNGGSMVASAALAATEDNRADRNADIVNSVQAMVGVANQLLRPLPAVHGAAPVRAMPDGTREERLARLSAAQDLVARGAGRAREPYELVTQAGAIGFNLIAGVAIWQVADFRHAWQSTIPSILIGEIQLFTTPWGPVDDLNSYRTEFAPGHAINWRVTPWFNGVQVSANF
jgi:hypothetical protein